eukprot:TRINITY_DN34875_c0_g1_i1.p1 TRINITY_DN34875_c0_g1~~TRINITY_DN34875_c0_g1_i1.p1  ORF type:complete len:459 (+),score=146.35 TRINITY_DN34875_c0_g1_i1:74-1378(+)
MAPLGGALGAVLLAAAGGALYEDTDDGTVGAVQPPHVQGDAAADGLAAGAPGERVARADADADREADSGGSLGDDAGGLGSAEGAGGVAPPPPPRVVVIADLHGDYLAALAVLHRAGLIARPEPPVEWTGGAATLVQLGDLCDRGPFSPQLIDLFDITLREQARAAGGKVVTLLGNHELLNVEGLSLADDGVWLGVHGVSREEADAFPGGLAARRTAFSPGGEYGRRLLSRFEGVWQEGGTLFVHAGVLPDHARLGVSGLRRAHREAQANGDVGKLFGALNVFEPRDLVTGLRGEPDCAKVKQVLQLLNAARSPGEPAVERIVVGHTPQHSEGAAVLRCRGGGGAGSPQLIAADVAVSRWMWEGGWLGWMELLPPGAAAPPSGPPGELGADGWRLIVRSAGRYQADPERPRPCPAPDAAARPRVCPHPAELRGG